jgi:hypothetical protein
MTTPTTQTTRRARRLVPLAVAFALAACATTTPSRARDDRTVTQLTVRVENSSRERIRVYLVGQQREWFLGPVEPGMVSLLVVPERSLGAGTVQLAVLTGSGVNMQVARDPRAVTSMGQPTMALLEQRWTYAHGMLMPMRME